MSGRSFDVSVSHQGRCLVEVEGFPVFENEITFLFGESGIGKSVISKALYGFHTTTDLEISINGAPYGSHLADQWTREVKRNGFFVFQEPSSHLNPLQRIRDQLQEGSLAGLDEKEICSHLWRTAPDETLRALMDLFPKPYRPSGGEKQRLLLTMAFKRIDAWIHGATPGHHSFFVFDEPTGSLDNVYRNIFLKLLFGKYVARPCTVLIITHDYSVISEIREKYRGLSDRIRYLELSRVKGATVAVSKFSPDEYLSWLGASRAIPARGPDGPAPVLEVQPSFTVFGRTLSIYADGGRTVLQPLRINRGEMVYLKAPSGVGKTTLAKVIMGLYRPDRFSMRLCGEVFTERTPRSRWSARVWGKRAGMVFQHADEALNLASTVGETFKGLPIGRRLSGRNLVDYLMELFDRPISDSFLGNKVAHLSGGQKQRLNLLRTLALGTDLVILDEPLNGLDFASVKKVLAMLDEKRARGCAMLMISHNEEIFEHFIGEEHIHYLGTHS